MHRKVRIRHKTQWLGAKVDCTEICTTSLSKHTGKERRPGFCVYIGAPRSVVWLKEVMRMYNRIGRCLKLIPSNRKFRFADSEFESLGTAMIPLETPPGIPTIQVSLDVVSTDVPALLGRDVMDENSLTPCTVSNRLVKRTVVDHKNPSQSYTMNEWSVPLKRYEGHLYAQVSIPVLTFFSKPQLLKLHRHFSTRPRRSFTSYLGRRVQPTLRLRHRSFWRRYQGTVTPAKGYNLDLVDLKSRLVLNQLDSMRKSSSTSCTLTGNQYYIWWTPRHTLAQPVFYQMFPPALYGRTLSNVGHRYTRDFLTKLGWTREPLLVTASLALPRPPM